MGNFIDMMEELCRGKEKQGYWTSWEEDRHECVLFLTYTSAFKVLKFTIKIKYRGHSPIVRSLLLPVP